MIPRSKPKNAIIMEIECANFCKINGFSRLPTVGAKKKFPYSTVLLPYLTVLLPFFNRTYALLPGTSAVP